VLATTVTQLGGGGEGGFLVRVTHPPSFAGAVTVVAAPAADVDAGAAAAASLTYDVLTRPLVVAVAGWAAGGGRGEA
jgi:hypothetical protein